MKDKQIYDAYLDENMEEIWTIAQYIHAHPEIGYKEVKACQIQCDFLRKYGFEVQQGIGDLNTAFVAAIGHGNPVIAIVSEYDALPSIGHACGHNLISTTALAAAIEVKKFMMDEEIQGTLKVIGTPAEEGGGGKIQLLSMGIFEDVDSVFMMHPTSAPTRLAGECMSSMRLSMTFKGKSAHASSHPQDGVNALSAANLYFVATGLLRQHFYGDMRLSGIITKGGKSSGLIPDEVSVEGSISSFNLKELKKNSEKVKHCAEGAALAMDCLVDFHIEEGYQGRIPNKILSDLCKSELIALDEPLMDGMPFDYGGEDLGNVSRLIPICNPYVTIFPDYKISNHTEQFRELANSLAGKRCIDIGGKGMARTIMELFVNPVILKEAKAELKRRLSKEDDSYE